MDEASNKDTLKGCLIVLVICFILSGLLMMCNSLPGNDSNKNTSQDSKTVSNTSQQDNWYSGGTLHKASIAEWKQASSANKLATAADWLANTAWKGYKLNASSDFEQFKGKAQLLADQVDKAVSGNSAIDSQPVSEVVISLMLISKDWGPRQE